MRKEAGKFVEGVILSNRLKALFRAIPPRLCFALTMTEKHEKAEREAIMQQFNCSELNAAIQVAEKLNKRGINDG